MGAALIAGMVGASAAFPLDLIFRLQPKNWIEVMPPPTFFIPANLYLQLPSQRQMVEAPFDIFCGGALLSAIWMIVRGWGRRPFSWPCFVYLSLVVGSFTGYCTFFLFGYVFVVLPALFLVALRHEPARLWERMLPIALSGIVSLALSWPLFFAQLTRRGHSVVVSGYEPIYLWVPHHPAVAGVVWIAAAILLLTVLLNPLGFWASFGHSARSPWSQALRWIFLWGCLTCPWGAQGYVLKMGAFISLVGVCLFVFQMRRDSLFERTLGAFCLLGPTFLVLNDVRANVMVEKIEPIWHVIDRAALPSALPVYFDCDSKSVGKLPPYFSRARFLGSPARFDNQIADFLSDVTALKTLPAPPERLRKFSSENAYLLLQYTDKSQTSAGTLIYQDSLYTLTRQQIP
jgi:hypothetical protein